MIWACTKCGACCRQAEKVLGHIDVGFPYSFNKDGSCEKYDPKIGCTVYEDRPAVCRMNVVARETTKHLNISKKEFYKRTVVSCNAMMDELNIDNSFRINK